MTTTTWQEETRTIEERFEVRPATLDDVEAAVEMFNRCSQETVGADEFNAERYNAEWQSPGFDLETDSLLVITPEGQVVGCGEVWARPPYVQMWCWSRVDPAYRGQGIGTYLLEWSEARCRELMPQAPEGARVVMRRSALGTEQPAQALFGATGFRPARHFWRMEIALDAPPPEPQWPEGIALRAYLPGDDDEVVYRAMDDAFSDHWGHVPMPFEEGFERFQHFIATDPERDPALWFLAVDEASGEIAGISLCRPHVYDDEDLGWVNTLGVRRPYRRRGLALALLHHSFGTFYRRGTVRVGLGVDATSLTGATRLYEKAGMHITREDAAYEKELRAGIDLSTQSVEA